MRWIRCAIVIGLFGLATFLWAERLPGTGEGPDPPRRTPSLGQSSGYEFAGTVKAVEHPSSDGHGVRTTRITFHVDTPVRGVHRGQTLVISEWAGLWAAGEQYRVGERVFLFLYPPSKLGLTSPVRGEAGKFRIGGSGRVVVRPEQKWILPERVSRVIGNRPEVDIREFASTLRSGEQE